MAAILVDSNVLLDLMSEDGDWFAWSSAAIEQNAASARLVINPIVFAEVSVRFSRLEELDALLPRSMFSREGNPLRGGIPRPFEASQGPEWRLVADRRHAAMPRRATATPSRPAVVGRRRSRDHASPIDGKSGTMRRRTTTAGRPHVVARQPPKKLSP